MILGIYSMRDVLNGFMNCFPEKNDDLAKRGFIHAIRTARQDTLFFSNPEDYSLYKLATFDTDSGKIVSLSAPEFLVGGESCK